MSAPYYAMMDKDSGAWLVMRCNSVICVPGAHAWNENPTPPLEQMSWALRIAAALNLAEWSAKVSETFNDPELPVSYSPAKPGVLRR